MSDRPTTEEKAEAFDAIVKMLQGKLRRHLGKYHTVFGLFA